MGAALLYLEYKTMAKRKTESFSQRIDRAISDLSERVELADKDIVREASKLYSALYHEILGRSKGENGSGIDGEDITEISLD
jgi:hypothetical protein